LFEGLWQGLCRVYEKGRRERRPCRAGERGEGCYRFAVELELVLWLAMPLLPALPPSRALALLPLPPSPPMPALPPGVVLLVVPVPPALDPAPCVVEPVPELVDPLLPPVPHICDAA
jgi:hypothetical protein